MLIQKIKAYVEVNNLPQNLGNVSCISEDGVESIVLWDEALGLQPTNAQLDDAYEKHLLAIEAMPIRKDRNQRLKDSDWTQVADAPVDKAAWAAYRQALRDISAQAGFPWNVTWPEMP